MSRPTLDEEVPGVDPGIAIATGLLICMGVVTSYSATAALALDSPIPPLFFDHLLGLMLGLLAALFAYHLPGSLLKSLAMPAWAVGVGLLIATLVIGIEVNGAQRWIALPGLRFQPGEFAKCATLIAVAAWLSRKDDRREISTRRSVEAAGIAIVPAGLLLAQPDLGNAVVLLVLTAGLLFIAGTPWPRFVLPGIAGSVLVGVYIASNAYAWRRIMGFLDPFREAQGAGWQLVQSYVAFGQGGFLGQGLGNGRQKLEYLPEVHTDFVLALIAEEMGLIGVLFVLGAFAVLWVAGTRAARRATDRFDLLCAFGMVTLLTVPAFLNASVVMGLVPTKGPHPPLPLLWTHFFSDELFRSGHLARCRATPSRSSCEPERGGPMAQRWVIAGGGTGATSRRPLALGEALRERGDEVLFVGSARGLESKLVPDAGFDLEMLPSEQVMGRNLLGSIQGGFSILRCTLRARKILKRFRADAVISVGGYAAMPAALAARLTRRPLFWSSRTRSPDASIE